MNKREYEDAFKKLVAKRQQLLAEERVYEMKLQHVRDELYKVEEECVNLLKDYKSNGG